MRLGSLIPRRARDDDGSAPPWPRLGSRSVRVAAPLLLIAALVVAALLASRDGALITRERPAAVADLVPYDGRSPREPAAEELRVIVALPRRALGETAGRRSPARQRAYVASLKDEDAALRSALAARDVELRDVTTFQRVFNGFAATVDVEDLADLSSLGVRTQPVRRTYPAISEPVPAPAAPRGGARPGAPGERVALLAGGAEGSEPGYDAVDGDRDPSPEADLRRREVSGTALAGVLEGAGARVVPVRVASLRTGAGGVEEAGSTDVLLRALEWVVDPDRDGATNDALPVAVAGVHAPYAGFADAPEARAARSASRLGTLLVAPAGHEGSAATVGSPGAARAALTVGALTARRAVPRVALTVGEEQAPGAALLAGAPVAGLRTAGPVTADDPDAFLRPGAPRLQGRAAVVRAGANPAAQVAAAAAAGARMVLLADPGERPLPSIPAGRVPVPVIGVTGPAARAILALGPDAAVRIGPVQAPENERPATATNTPESRTAPGSGGEGAERPAASPFSSRGPSLSATRKPDLVAAGAARTTLASGRPGIVGGTGVAASLAAVEAARLAAARPDATPRELAGALRAAALPAAGPPEATGAGALPSPVPATRDFAPPPRMATPAPGPVPLGALELTRENGRVTGVRFTVGAFERGDARTGGTRLQAAGTLELTVRDAEGKVVRRLTPPGGARDLLPAEYAYTLPADALAGLPSGRLRFRAVARPPGGGRATIESSRRFEP